MIVKPWGTPWTLKYKPQVGAEYVTPAGSPSIYLFQDQPSEAAARAGTGALSTVSTWSYDALKKQATATIPAIADPQDGTRKRQYWIAINYFIDSASNQKQLDLRTFWLIVPDGMDEECVPTPADIKGYYDTSLAKEYGVNADSFLNNFIRRAETAVKRDLKWAGYNWPRLENVGDLKDAIAFKALMAYLDLSEDPDDIWMERFKLLREDYKTAIDSVAFQIGDQFSQVSDPESTPNTPKTLKLVK